MNSSKSKRKFLSLLGKNWNRFSKSFWKAFSFVKKNKQGFLDQEKVDKNLVYTLASSKIPNSEQIKQLDKTLSRKEKTIIRICLAVVLINAVYLGIRYYENHVKFLPVSGGVYEEGLIGYPKNINPLYSANRDVDNDISKLIFSSLFKYDERGNLIGDLAEKIETVDNKEFVVTVRSDVKWHSGEQLLVDDIIFTFNLIQNAQYGSPLRANFSGVEVTKVSDNVIKFVLPSAYSFFPNFLTFGIMPQSIWENIAPESANLSELNLQAIGSGPYMFSSLVKDKKGSLKEYRLVANENYYGTKPYIKEVTFKLYPDSNELINALNSGDVQGISYLSAEQKKALLAQNSLRFNILSSSQESLIFFNSSKNSNLSDLKVRQAMALSIDKAAIVKNLFSDFYNILNGPLPSNSPYYNDEIEKHSFNLELANAKLDEAGWQKIEVKAAELSGENLSDELKEIASYASSSKQVADGIWRFKKDKKGNVSLLTVKLSVVDNADASVVADKIKGYWEAIGLKTEIVLIPVAEASASVLSRNFETMLYSEMVGSNPDLFFFWHSSQIGSKGLNVAAYSNDKVDKLLEDVRLSADANIKNTNYQEIQKIINSELPAIFLYENSYIYVQSKKLKGFAAASINDPSDRFSGISNWYLKTKNKFSF